MPSPSHTMIELWESASDPVLIIDGNSRVVWANQSALDIALKARLPSEELNSYFPPDTVKQIYSIQQFGTLQLQLPIGKTTTSLDSKPELINQIAIVVELGSGDPAGELRVVILKTPYHSSGYFGRYDEFLATVTHDLKNPLGAIHGYADLLLDTPAGIGINEKQREILGRIRNCSLRMIELIRNYQYLFRIQAEEIGLITPSQPSATNVRQILQSVVEYCWREGPEAPLLSIEVPDPNLSVAVDRVNLERVLSNLLSNAVTHTPSGKQISISAQASAGHAIIEVQNEGSLISAELLPRVFGLYSQGSGVRDRKGTGLGLYIVKSIVDRVAGEVEVTSDQKNGTSFKLKLPLAQNSSKVYLDPSNEPKIPRTS